MAVLVALDKFRGTLTAAQACDIVVEELSRHGVSATPLPIADGGEATVEALCRAGFVGTSATVEGPLGTSVRATYAVRGRTAVIEAAEACGLHLVQPSASSAGRSSSHGVGQLIREALNHRCDRIVLALGGTASTDGGAGMLVALGARLLDDTGREIGLGGVQLGRVRSVDLSRLDPRTLTAEVVVAADVSAPLLGADGAVDLYSAQKGADADTRKALRDGLARWSTLVSPLLATSAGAGAGGGIGFAASSVLGAEVVSGAQLVLGLIGFHEALGASSAVVTGEGKLDTQTLQGKGPWEVVNLCQGAGVPSTFICGTSSLETVPAAPGLHILRMDKHDDHHVDSMTDPEGALRRLVRNNVDTVSGARR